ncbi:hypothetical protein GOBAR_AA14297 [Gossypium barbadense]|uniref:Uncharacterized protein n=1 Tax=Gossypium barbadense TaxID=3634 RepID=A0A2P5XSU5_GOSBA|nr:hypothetical protein GOBAR_AA14297 [Gossypium barbadense]
MGMSSKESNQKVNSSIRVKEAQGIGLINGEFVGKNEGICLRVCFLMCKNNHVNQRFKWIRRDPTIRTIPELDIFTLITDVSIDENAFRHPRSEGALLVSEDTPGNFRKEGFIKEIHLQMPSPPWEMESHRVSQV